MGKIDFDDVVHIFNFLVDLLETQVVSPLVLVSQTIVFQLNFHQVNLHKCVHFIPNSIFEPELFPSLTFDKFKPLHVNLFSTGKVVVLGRNALCMKVEIEDWLNEFLNKHICDNL